MEGKKSPVMSVADIKTEAISDDEEKIESATGDAGARVDKTYHYNVPAIGEHIYMPHTTASVFNTLKVEPVGIVENVSAMFSGHTPSTKTHLGLDPAPLHAVSGQDLCPGFVSEIPEGNNFNEQDNGSRNLILLGHDQDRRGSHLLKGGQKDFKDSHPTDAEQTGDYNHSQHHTANQSHLSTNTLGKSFSCKFCARQFLWSRDLEQHQLVHTYSTPFKCNVCNMDFSFSSRLKAHMKIHAGCKPWKCDSCGLSFKCKTNLQTHLGKHA